MIIDKQLELSSSQAVTASAASTNYINQGVKGEAYEALWLVFRTAVACTDSGSDSTVDFSLQTDDNSSFSSAKTLFSTGALARADYAAAGKVVAKVRIPSGSEQYLRAYYTVSGGSLSTGAFDAFFVSDVEIKNY